VSSLPSHIAERQAQSARDMLAEELVEELAEVPIDIAEEKVEGVGRGSFCFLRAEYTGGGGGGGGVSQVPPSGFSALGRRGKRAETVGQEAAGALLSHLRNGVALEDHLADQVLPFLALAPGTSRYTVPQVSSHLRTNAWVCERLLDIRVGLHEDLPCTVEVQGAGWRR